MILRLANKVVTLWQNNKIHKIIMKKVFIALTTLVTLGLTSCMENQIKENPFYSEFDTPHATVPFSKIDISHYEAAIDSGIVLNNQAIDAIVNQRSRPTFENTILALENSDRDLNRVLNVFYPLTSALSDDQLMEISIRVSAKLSEHSTSISLNEGLWNRIK